MVRGRTVLRSVRIRSDLADVLVGDAESAGVSVNSLVSSILTKYAEWDRFADRFGFLTLTRNGLQSHYEAIGEERLAALSREAGRRNPPAMTLFWFKRYGLGPFLNYLRLITRYGRLAELEVEQHGRSVTILLHHTLGPKHSIVIRNMIGEATQQIVGVVPRVQMGVDSVVFRFEAPEDSLNEDPGSLAPVPDRPLARTRDSTGVPSPIAASKPVGQSTARTAHRPRPRK